LRPPRPLRPGERLPVTAETGSRVRPVNLLAYPYLSLRERDRRWELVQAWMERARLDLLLLPPSDPVLPLVRGILSWNQLPPPASPFWPPIWGNALDAHIQAAPRTGIICLLDDILVSAGVKLDPKQFDIVEQALPQLEYTPEVKENYTLEEITRIYGKDIEPSRKGFGFVSTTLFTKAVKCLSDLKY
jgi:hypothetical protein